MNTETYLKKWEERVKSSPEYKEEYAEHADVYREVSSFFDEGIDKGLVSRDTVVNMCFSLLVTYLAESGVCPACEFYDASEEIHKEMQCPDVH